MGNDGGSIPTRRELVKEAARNPTTSELKESQHEQQTHHWTTDPISLKPLAAPIVSDSAGRLYNKETILEYLVTGTHKEEADRITQGAIKSLKDVVEVKFEEDEVIDLQSGSTNSHKIWKCPVTGDRLGPGSKAAYIVPCGHAFSGSAIKEVSGEKCLTCETEYASNDVIPILPTAATDVARLALRVKTLQEKGLAHSLKKAAGAGGGGKKRKKKDEVAVENSSATTVDSSKGASVGSGQPRTSTPVNGNAAEPEGPLGINNASTASLTAKVMEEQAQAKKRKMENENVRSLFSSRDQSKPIGRSSDFMSRGYSLPTAGGK